MGRGIEAGLLRLLEKKHKDKKRGLAIMKAKEIDHAGKGVGGGRHVRIEESCPRDYSPNWIVGSRGKIQIDQILTQHIEGECVSHMEVQKCPNH